MAQPFPELNAEYTGKALRRLGERLRDGRITLTQFEALAAREIRDAVTVAFRFANGGPLDDRQSALLGNLLAEQRVYFERMITGLRDGSVPLAHAPNRAAAYAGATTQAAALASVSRAAPNDFLVWRGPDGPSACADCLARIGRTFTRAELIASGMPGQMQCRGNCRCSVTPLGVAA